MSDAPGSGNMKSLKSLPRLSGVAAALVESGLIGLLVLDGWDVALGRGLRAEMTPLRAVNRDAGRDLSEGNRLLLRQTGRRSVRLSEERPNRCDEVLQQLSRPDRIRP